MPRPPRLAASLEILPGRVYAPVAEGVAAPAQPPIPLNVGDTWMEPCEAARMEAQRVAEHPGLHRYCDTQGIAPLREALAEKLRARGGIACDPSGVLVTAGATGGLACAVGALVDPGDEVLILAPFWPLIRGIVQAFRAVPVEVPFYDRVDSAATAVEAVRERITPRTVALYIANPSNPTGRVLPRAWVEALVELALREGLWILSDEVYEDFVYRGVMTPVAPFAPERTLTAHSFSKAYGMAGNRVGYLAGPPALLAQAEKFGTHLFYHAPTAGQWAALAALREGAPWIANASRLYQQSGDAAAAALGLPSPEGSTFLFVDVSERLDERGIRGFLADCVADGFALAPGSACGRDYENWVRLCYTAAPPEQVAVAVERLARRLGRAA